MLSKIEMNESDIILKLSEKAKEIDILKEKINFLYTYLKIDEKDFLKYLQYKKNPNFFEIANQSNIISNILELITPFEGIYKILNKKVKEIKLIYQASKDGDKNKDFHSKCDGKENTLTLIKTTKGRKFGGFVNVKWVSSPKYIKDENAFVFSLEKT